MKNSTQRNNQVLQDDAGNFVGVVLAADFTSEHEWGIKRLRSKLGLVENPQSFADNCIKEPIQLRIAEDGSGNEPYTVTTAPEHYSLSRLGGWWGDPGEIEFTSAWDDSDFMIKALSKGAESFLPELVDAFARGDAAVFLGGGAMAFGNAGLVLCIASKVPQELKDQMDAAYNNSRQLKAAADATGIRERIDAYNKANNKTGYGFGYYALSPAWNSKGRENPMREGTAYDVVFWLNPTGQDKNNYGWFTVEELDQWLEGKGPIPKVDKVKTV